MLISVQQMADDDICLFWLQEDWRKVELLRKSRVGPIKNMLGTCCNRNCRSLELVYNIDILIFFFMVSHKISTILTIT